MDAKSREKNKALAIRFAVGWAMHSIKGYKEPSREGVPKGDLIGFPGNKKFAALLMCLFPNALSNSVIAEMARVTPGVLSVWRTQDNFNEECEKAYSSLAAELVRLIEVYSRRYLGFDEPPETAPAKYSGFEKDPLATLHMLIAFLPFFNNFVFSQVAEWLLETGMGKQPGLSTVALMLGYLAMENRFTSDKKTAAKWEAMNLGLTKTIIQRSLEDPELTSELRKEKNDALLDFIFEKLDILAGGIKCNTETRRMKALRKAVQATGSKEIKSS